MLSSLELGTQKQRDLVNTHEHHYDPKFKGHSNYSAVLEARHIRAFLSHARSGISMLPPELLKQYIQEGRLSQEGPDRILLPSSSELVVPSPHAIITTHTSTFAHYLLSENEPVSVCIFY